MNNYNRTISIGGFYMVRVDSLYSPVKIIAEGKSFGCRWIGKSLRTGRTIRIKKESRLMRQMSEAAAQAWLEKKGIVPQ